MDGIARVDRTLTAEEERIEIMHTKSSATYEQSTPVVEQNKKIDDPENHPATCTIPGVVQ